MSLHPQPSTVAEEGSAGSFVVGTTTGFSGNEWWGGLFLFVFAAGWLASLVPLAGMLATPTGAGLIFLLAFLGIWIPTGALVAIPLVWGTIGGRETVVLDSAALILRQGVGRLALTRAYETNEVSDFRVVTGETVFRSGYAVAFTANGRTVRFGNWPDRNEAEAVAGALSARLDELIEPPQQLTIGVIHFRARPQWARNWFFLFFLIAWAAGWSALWVSDKAVEEWQTAGITAVSFLIAVLLATSLVRDVFRSQRVSVGPAGIEIQRSVGPLRWTRHHDRAAIRDVRAVPVLTEDGPEEDRFELALDLGRRTVRFGIGLTRNEAEAAARELNERLSS